MSTAILVVMRRLGYRKSRNGCERCKKRRVKCNEASPCSACERHGITCSLLSRPSSYADRQASSTRRRVRHVSVTTSLSPTDEDTPPPPADVPHASQPASPHGDIAFFDSLRGHAQCATKADAISDIELIHHYTATAHATIASTDRVCESLQCDIPREGFSSPALLHQILAFSAFHLAYTQPQRRQAYLFAASHHQDKAVRLLRSTLADSLTPENCHSAYATSVFLIISGFATYPSFEINDPTFSPIDSMCDVFALITGMAVILNSSDRVLREGPLRRLFGQTSNAAVVQPLFQTLINQIAETKLCLGDSHLGLSEEDRAAAISAIEALIESIAQAELKNSLGTPPELRAAFRWPIQVGNQFGVLVKQRQPAALVVLAHYAVLLKYGEITCWFLQHWAIALVKSITKELEGTLYASMIVLCVENIC